MRSRRAPRHPKNEKMRSEGVPEGSRRPQKSIQKSRKIDSGKKRVWKKYKNVISLLWWIAQGPFFFCFSKFCFFAKFCFQNARLNSTNKKLKKKRKIVVNTLVWDDIFKCLLKRVMQWEASFVLVFLIGNSNFHIFKNRYRLKMCISFFYYFFFFGVLGTKN